MPTLYRLLVDRLDAVPQAWLCLLMRVAIVPVFWRAGWSKASNMEQAVALFREEYKVPLLPPDLAAYLGTAVELGAPALILVGFLARLATLPLLGLVGVIQFLVYPVSYPDHVLWFAILAFILVRGPGSISLDRLVFGRG